MSANVQDLFVCLAVWFVPTALLGLVGLVGDRLDRSAASDGGEPPALPPGRPATFGLPGAAS